MESAFLLKALENLKAAEVLYESKLYNASANRAYYAAFQAAVAALNAAGIPIIKLSHEYVQEKFNGELIQRRKVYPGRIKSYLMELQQVRNYADYKEKSVSQKTAKDQLKMARELLDKVQKAVNHD